MYVSVWRVVFALQFYMSVGRGNQMLCWGPSEVRNCRKLDCGSQNFLEATLVPQIIHLVLEESLLILFIIFSKDLRNST